MSILKVAIIQKQAVANDKAANLQLAIKYITKAKDMGADIVLFPEMWSNSYAPPFETAFDNPYDKNYVKEREKWICEGVKQDSDYVDKLKNTAKQLQIGVVATYLEKTFSKPKNSAIIIDRNGNIILDYAKVHTCDFSLEGLLQCGDEFKVCEFCGVKLGVMICYDREFPESARLLMLKGAEIILVPNACQMNPARLNQLSTRAFENMVGVCMANYPSSKWGCSCAFSPIVFDDDGNYLDNTLAIADDMQEQIMLVEFDIDKIREYRKKETWGNAYRKPKAYAKLTDTEVCEPFIRPIVEPHFFDS